MGAGGEGDGGAAPGNDDYIVIGAGPVGLLAVLGLIQEQGARKVTIYEAREGLATRVEESYPIGLNPRGVQALDRANPDLALGIRQRGAMVDGWKIYAGRRQVAEVRSGLVIGTTRSAITQALYDEIRRHHSGKVTFHWGHRLVGIDTLRRRLRFARRPRRRSGKGGSPEKATAVTAGVGEGERREGEEEEEEEETEETEEETEEEEEEEEVVVDAGGARVVACDGAWSRTRECAKGEVPGFKSRVTPWHAEFRLLFSPPGARAPGLDPRYHHVINGVYVSVIERDVWVLALGIRDTMPEKANVRALRDYVMQTAPQAAPFLTEEDLVQYFSRRSFRGAVVKVNQLHLGEWLVFLGDAAHSVIPPTGEGFNAGAEDVGVLLDAMHDTPEAPFAKYTEWRLRDLHALHALAMDANRQLGGPAPERIASIVAQALVSLGKSLGLFAHTVQDLSFGVDSYPPRPYQQIVVVWRWQRRPLLLLARLLVYPIFLLSWVLTAPVWVLLGLLRSAKS